MSGAVDQQSCVRLHWAKSLTGFKFCATTRNKNIQQHATGCANGRNMKLPIMLAVVTGQQFYVRLHAALHTPTLLDVFACFGELLPKV